MEEREREEEGIKREGGGRGREAGGREEGGGKGRGEGGREGRGRYIINF